MVCVEVLKAFTSVKPNELLIHVHSHPILLLFDVDGFTHCRLNGKEENGGHRVLGYMVYFDGELWAMVEGALASQVEVHDLQWNTQYSVQVW